MFFREFADNFQNSVSTEHLQTAASETRKLLFHFHLNLNYFILTFDLLKQNMQSE